MARFEDFAALHRLGTPLILYNIWDAGSARAVVDAGAPAVATGSWSAAAAHGYDDGEALPLDLSLTVAARIVASVSVPVTIDFEGGYAVEPAELTRNAARLAATGAVGCNFEDGIVGGEGRHDLAAQTARIAALREGTGEAFFINARTDIFLSSPPESHADGMAEALERAAAYAEAGANGFFVPGLVDPGLIGKMVEGSPLPVNIMALRSAPDAATLASLGVARISHGPGPYRQAMQALTEAASALYA